MICYDKTFTEEEIKLLKAMKGRVLMAEGHVPISGNIAFGRLRLYLDGGNVDIVADMHGIDYTGDGTFDDDEAFLAVEPAKGGIEDITEIDGAELRTEYGKTVQRVLVAQDAVDSYENGELTFKMAFPQAIILDLGDECVCIDKQDGPWAMVTVKRGADLSELIYDCAEGWADTDESPELHNEFKQELVKL